MVRKMELFIVVYRTVFFYFFITLAYRLMGKREIGQLGVVDLIVSILNAELVAISIENKTDSILFTILPITVLVVLEILLAWLTMKFRGLRTILDGKPSLIIYNGKINYREMVKQRYNLDDLMISMREKAIHSIDEIEYAFLEPNGKLSIFKYNLFKIPSPYPMPIIEDGKINTKSLERIHKSEVWLRHQLIKNKITLNNVFYAFYRNKQIFIIKKNQLN
jgi:uncharacterized membrane protein YcaP (DUF421 family)